MKRTFTTCALLLALAGTAMSAPGGHGHSHTSYPAGEPGDAKKPARTIPVTMRETDDGRMLFFPDNVEVRVGEQVRFILRNGGREEHEFVLDTVENNMKHKAAMQKNADMEHDDPNARRVASRKSSEIVWKFTKPGSYEFACLLPGHYEAGMRGTVTVK